MPESEKACRVAFVERPNSRFSRRSTSREWSTIEIRALRELADAGVSMQAIAAKLHRSVSAVKNKASFHGISVFSARVAEPVE